MDDRTKAMALKIAVKKLDGHGWKYSMQDIGIAAAAIINAMNDGLSKKNG